MVEVCFSQLKRMLQRHGEAGTLTAAQETIALEVYSDVIETDTPMVRGRGDPHTHTRRGRVASHPVRTSRVRVRRLVATSDVDAPWAKGCKLVECWGVDSSST